MNIEVVETEIGTDILEVQEGAISNVEAVAVVVPMGVLEDK